MKLNPVSTGDALPDLQTMDPQQQNTIESALARAMAVRRQHMGLSEEPSAAPEEAVEDDEWN